MISTSIWPVANRWVSLNWSNRGKRNPKPGIPGNGGPVMSNRKPGELQIAQHCREHLDNEILLLQQFVETSESINQRVGLRTAEDSSPDELFRSITGEGI